MAFISLPALLSRLELQPEPEDDCHDRCRWSHDPAWSEHQLHQQPSASPRRQRTFLICGQSNALGYGRRSELDASEKKRIAAVADRITVARPPVVYEETMPSALREGSAPSARLKAPSARLRTPERRLRSLEAGCDLENAPQGAPKMRSLHVFRRRPAAQA